RGRSHYHGAMIKSPNSALPSNGRAPEIEADIMKMRSTHSQKSILMRGGLMLAVVLLAGLAAATPAAASRLYEVSFTGCGGVEAPVVDEAFELRVVELVNQERANNGNLPPLKRAAALTSA